MTWNILHFDALAFQTSMFSARFLVTFDDSFGCQVRAGAKDALFSRTTRNCDKIAINSVFFHMQMM